MKLPTQVDVLIVGGGPVGGALALSLANSQLSVAVLEARLQPGEDARALAIAHASQQTLVALDVWPSAAATAIHSVHVSQQGGFGRVRLRAADLDLPVLGYVLPYVALAKTIHAHLQAASGARLHYLTGCRAIRLQTLDGYAVVNVEGDGQTALMTARLVVLAEGGQLLAEAGIGQDQYDYEQRAITAEVRTDKPHGGVAFERFATDGPIAMLPKDDGYAMVWTRPKDDPLDAANLDEVGFLRELQARLGDRVGRLNHAGPRAVFPLRLKWASSHQARRVAVVGNAAQTLHPVAGQGFNLGLRDALTLARVIHSVPTAQLGQATMLARYADLRKVDSLTTIGVTDGLIRLFGNGAPLLRHFRAAGFLAMDNFKPLRRGFAQRMVFGSR
ncbi:FAD-dependent monooxygenase [Chitinimonas sp. BJB300]|uniref:FAD-dependent monooxygenase n=1 Tax=Chitinimonas sp. BJB300 TaxID=1559339 RepID=UPI000C10F867|nr:FAD-dependent monooxygenase [Chitinimonas sp. BJB300]PHV12211.1 2-octaprenyl-6-methoxyphenyl hydroxylase [Chitinimonas sp. BJB300]TSJ91616.1 2-octaprenyl-6-methoxyphenyl hydroxylase [Chitinimonas sp. BJB300]